MGTRLLPVRSLSRPRALLVLALLALLAPLAPAARADRASLARNLVPRPGPPLLYRAPAVAPQLTNSGPWRAAPILVSGATAYRDGEFLYQDFLYDDHGARAQRDPRDPRAGADLFSPPNGTYTYPRSRVYAENAADLVELRLRRVRGATLFRLTFNTMKDPSRMAAVLALGSGASREIPGANTRVPAKVLVIWHGGRAFVPCAGDCQYSDPFTARVRARVDRRRRQVTITVNDSVWRPGQGRRRIAAATALWDRGSDSFLIPRGASDATHAGGAGALAHPTAFFNVAFRSEPLPRLDLSALTDPTWWRDRRQGAALAHGDLGAFHADVDFGKLARRVHDDSRVARFGALDRILASHTETEQGADYRVSCTSAERCEGELRGRLQPYALYVPRHRPARGRYGLTLLLHSLTANYNQFAGSRNQSQFGDRGRNASLVLTPSGRGPDGWYYDRAGADTWEAWADVAARYRLDPDRAAVTGYSMGGYGTWKLATQFPDLFGRAQPTVGPPGLGSWTPPAPPAPGGERSNTNRMLASLRHVPVLAWNGLNDELVPYPGALRQADALDRLRYRYELDSFPSAAVLPPTPTPNHLQLAVNDQFAPAADFLGASRVVRDPAHVTYVYNPTMDFARDGTRAGHAYWISDIVLRRPGGTAPLGTIDALSHGFGRGDAPSSSRRRGLGQLPAGTLGRLSFRSVSRAWGHAPRRRRADVLEVRARNVRSLTVDARRAHLSCRARVVVHSGGAVRVHLRGCR